MNNLLIVIGVGASIAQMKSQGIDAPRMTCNFFSDHNRLKDSHPHLWNIIDIIANSKMNWEEKSLTDGWLILDTIKKYILRYRPYDKQLLDKRLESKNEYPILQHLNEVVDQYLRSDIEINPNSCVYHFLPKTFGQEKSDAILTLAYFELIDLILSEYAIQKDNNISESPYISLLQGVKNSKFWDNIFIISLNYDMIFEKTNEHFRQNQQHIPLFFVRDLHEFEKLYGINARILMLCKPHGGFNVYHDSSTANIYMPSNPYIGFSAETFRSSNFKLMEPYLIPYFFDPDEFTSDHKNMFHGVNAYFQNQLKIMKEMIENTSHLLSIGYSFPYTDKHLFGTDIKRQNHICVYDIDRDEVGRREKNKRIKCLINCVELQFKDSGFTKASYNDFEKSIE